MPVRRTSPTARPVPRSVASVLAELELLAPDVVDRDVLHRAMQAAGDSRADAPGGVDRVIDTLRRAGWLLPLRARGLWEFAPANRSGAYGSGDPLLLLRAFLTRRPDAPVAVAMESAALRLHLAQHPPSREVVAVGEGVYAEGALKEFRTVVLDLGRRAVRPVEGLPVHTVEALLVSMGIKPAGYRDWANVELWLSQAAAEVVSREAPPDGSAASGVPGVVELLEGRPLAAWARVAYLLRLAEQEQAARQILTAAPGTPSGPVYLGPRGRPATYDALTHVYDSLVDRP